MAAMERPPAAIAPWRGPARGFSFNREVQPVLDRFCVGCHNGTDPKRPDFTRRPDVHAGSAAAFYDQIAHFPPAYLALRAYVRGHTIESDLHLLTPCEFHASTTELVRLLEAGHHGVRLDAEAWDRLNTWIDLNTPAHGTWTETVGEVRVAPWAERRRDLLRRYAAVDDDPEDTAYRQTWQPPNQPPVAPDAAPQSPPPPPPRLTCSVFSNAALTLDLGGGAAMRFVRVPTGAFVSSTGAARTFDRPLWVGVHEVRNRDYARFDPAHDSRIETGDFLQFSEAERGWPCNLPDQPVCRVSRERAEAFCAWLSAKTGRRCRLPDAAEWEWAARAGSTAPAAWGAATDAFTKTANLADKQLRTVLTLGWGLPSGAVPPYRPAAAADDGFRVFAPVGSYQPNAWGLYDTAGNVWEWTAETTADLRATARGGSWFSHPQNAVFDARVFYPPWQPVYDVGFRVVLDDR
jgi:formylglycine-generating enzyme required for sulfatase activity